MLLTLRLLLNHLALQLLLLRNGLMLLLLLNCLMLLLLLLLNSLVLLLLLGSCLSLLLLRGLLVVNLHGGWHANIVIRSDRPVDCQVGRTTMVDVGKLRTVVAGSALILHLRAHGRGVLFMTGSQLFGPGTHLQSA